MKSTELLSRDEINAAVNGKLNIAAEADTIYDKIREITQLGGQTDSGRENANINANSAMGVLNKAGSDALKSYYLREVIPADIAEAHKSGLIHIHDLDFYGFTETCLQIDLEPLFTKGFTTGHGTIRPPQSIRNYLSLVCIVIQSNQNDMHGGQSIPKFEYDCAPGVAKSYAKYLAEAVIDENNLRFSEVTPPKTFRSLAMDVFDRNGSLLTSRAQAEIIDLLNETYGHTASKYAMRTALEKTVEETLQGCEALVHNLCTMNSRAGGQVPFSSINYGTGTTPEERLIISCILSALDNGLGNGESQIFPIHIFKVKEGVNYNPIDPNYDLFKRAIKVTAHRMFPNFEFLDAPFNLQYYKSGDPDSEVGTMGCVDGSEAVIFKLDDIKHISAISFLFNIVSEKCEVQKSGLSEFVDTSDLNLTIYDTFSNSFVAVKKVIKNPNQNNWHRIICKNGATLTVTEDHPLPVEGRGVVKASEIQAGDKLYNSEEFIVYSPDKYSEVTENNKVEYDGCSYDVETASGYFDVSGIVSHNCRTRVIANINGPETTSGRGNLSFTSINLPRIAIEAKGDVTSFFEKLDSAAALVVRQLLHRFDLQCKRHIYNFPFLFGNKCYMNSEGLSENDSLFPALKNGTLTIGFVGLAEALVALIGKHHGESEEAQKLGLQIVERLRLIANEATKTHHLNFSLIGTPAESTCGTFLKKDRERFGVIPGVTDKEYYTNSNHIPVGFKISARRKIDLEAPYHVFENGGHITYIEFPGAPSQNLAAMEFIVRYMHDAHVGYGAINHKIDTCPVCGYTAIIGDRCPKCGNLDSEKPFIRLRRITGYLVGDRNTRFNDAKKAEEADRVEHEI